MKVTAKKIFGIGGWVLIGSVAGAFAQDVMQQRLPFLRHLRKPDDDCSPVYERLLPRVLINRRLWSGFCPLARRGCSQSLTGPRTAVWR
jgi:hypothetical protein